MTLEERLRDLEETLATTLAELAASRLREQEQQRENEALRRDNEALRKEIDAWKRGLRERKKRRSSRPESKPKTKGKSPGREAGHAGAFRPVPERIDATASHPPPEVCSCGGTVVLTGQEQSTIVQDIPPVEVQNVRHVAPQGQCTACGKKHQARLPGQPRAGASLAQVQLGPTLLALTLDLRFERHVPLAGISGLLGTWFGVDVTPSGIFQMAQRWKDRTASSYEELVVFTRASDLVGADETPWHQDGLNGWAWLLRTETSSLLRLQLALSRSRSNLFQRLHLYHYLQLLLAVV